jgi:CDP-paratose 2-epimerase
MPKVILITGGAGFIGSNLAASYLADGCRVIVFDNLSRPGVESNLEWLERSFGNRIETRCEDIRDANAVTQAVNAADAIFHLAAQVAVTSSLETPLTDFAVNVTGTLHVLEAIRLSARRPPLLFTSTNKVYGALDDLQLLEGEHRWEPAGETARDGISERRPLDFHSPYGCSKGSADAYVLDYARSFGLRSVVFRMSCIYGPRQFGTEDQGWVAHFVRAIREGRDLMIYGDGKQVRDLLFIEDLVRAMKRAEANSARLAGEAFNLGGGSVRSASLLEVVREISKVTGMHTRLQFEAPRVGDQKWYVSDTQKFEIASAWRPYTGVQEGIAALNRWLDESAPKFESVGAKVA